MNGKYGDMPLKPKKVVNTAQMFMPGKRQTLDERAINFMLFELGAGYNRDNL